MQTVEIVKAIVQEKRQRRIIPAHASELEIYARWPGTFNSMRADLNRAEADGILRCGRSLNSKYYVSAE